MEQITLVKAVIDIAKDAGAAIQEIYEKSAGIEIEKKSDNSPLTIADRTANKIICDALEKLPVKRLCSWL